MDVRMRAVNDRSQMEFSQHFHRADTLGDSRLFSDNLMQEVSDWKNGQVPQ